MAQQLFRPVATDDHFPQPKPAAPGRGLTTSPPSPPKASPSPGTRATHRMLLLRGLTTGEAANLTAYLCGIRSGERPWKVEEINRLLFLRDFHRRDAVANRGR
jgi:hypothetical protein